jgi:hypothetical protein
MKSLTAPCFQCINQVYVAVRVVTDTHTQTHRTDIPVYHNPFGACAPRVNKNEDCNAKKYTEYL